MRESGREGGREGGKGRENQLRTASQEYTHVHAINTWLSVRAPLTQNGIVMATRQRDRMANKSQN